MPAAKHLFIVGAGLSANAGLPLTSAFTEFLLSPVYSLLSGAPSRPLVRLLDRYIADIYNGGIAIGAARDWPPLEDVFTSLDLAANSGHNLGSGYSASDLRTVRRALLIRIIYMLNERYVHHRSDPAPEREALRQLFGAFPRERAAFLSMNWDTVIERGLERAQAVVRFDYGCGATPARFDDDGLTKNGADPALRTAVVLKPHGSINWLYCDACSRVFYVPPQQATRVARLLMRRIDRTELGRKPIPTGHKLKPVLCPGCHAEALGTRFATFSFRKALEFPMHQRTWRRAEVLLARARTWTFIGYSLPPADYEFKHLLKRVELYRRRKPTIVVVTKGDGPGSAAEAYQRFFGTTLQRRDVFVNGLTSKVMTRLQDLEALDPT